MPRWFARQHGRRARRSVRHYGVAVLPVLCASLLRAKPQGINRSNHSWSSRDRRTLRLRRCLQRRDPKELGCGCNNRLLPERPRLHRSSQTLTSRSSAFSASAFGGVRAVGARRKATKPKPPDELGRRLRYCNSVLDDSYCCAAERAGFATL